MITGAAAWLALTGRADIRYSADHTSTLPMWHRWVPALVGIALVRLTPPHLPAAAPHGRPDRFETVTLVAAAVTFAVALRAVGGGEPAHTLLKIPLLLGVPLVVFAMTRRRAPGLPVAALAPGVWRHYGPAVPVAAWLAISYASPLAVPPDTTAARFDAFTLVATVLVVFLVNAVLEEVFYRRWLQTRLEATVGPWPAIVVSSLLWAAWHVGIQGTGDLAVDLASAAVNQGMQGLFLGFLWSRYRMMWPILTVHGAANAAPLLLGLL